MFTIYFYFCVAEVEYSPVLRPVYSLPLLLNPRHYHMYDATSQEEDVAYRCEFLGVPPPLPSTPLPFDPPIPLGAQMSWNRVIDKLFKTDMTSRIAVSDGQPTPLPLTFVGIG